MSSRLLTNALRRAATGLIAKRAIPQAARLAHVRFNSSVPSATQQLAEVLKAELKASTDELLELDSIYQEYLNKSGFEVAASQGLLSVQLVKNTSDGETIRVFFDIEQVTDAPISDPETDEIFKEDGIESLLCNVRVVIERPGDNNGLFLNLFIQSLDPSFLVDSISYKSNVSKYLSEEVEQGEFINKVQYQGPRFSDLDESVQTGFENYLEAKGINEDLAEFIMAYSEFKEENEYRNWLSDLNKYVK